MIIIKSVTGGLRFSTPINEGATRKRALMGDDLITLPFSVARPITFKIGDYADIEGFGRFVITDTPQPTYNETTGGYDYELKMEAQYRKWKNKLLKFLPEVGASETTWVLTASIRVHAEQVMANINALCELSESYLYNGTTQWQISFEGMTDEELTTAQVVSYDSISILDGLSAIAEAFGIEYWVEDNTIHFGRCEFGDTHIPLEIGVNVESMTRNNTGEPFATRLYVFGSEKNLPATYRKDLIFTIDKVNGQLITDVARPLRAEWFNKDNYIYSDGSYQDYHVGFSLEQDVYKDPSYNDDSVLLTTGNWEGVTHRLDAVGTFDVGEYNVSMGGFKPRVIVTPTNETNDWRGIESIKGEVIVYSGDTEIARTLPMGVYIQSLDTEYVLSFPDFEFTIEGAAKGDISIVINLYAVFQHIGEAHVSVDAFADKIINIRHRRLIPGVKDVTLKVVSGEKEGTIIESCVFNPYFAKEGTTARPILLPDGVTLQEGDRFEIQNIKSALVPNAYYSASATLDNNSEIVQNGIVANRLMLPEGTPYIDAYDGLTAEEAVEDVVIFEEIYPQVESEITEVSVDYVSSEDEADEKEYPLYRFKTNTEFSTDYYIEGKTLSITIESGVLNGWTFEVVYSEAREEFTIVRDAENNVPNEILCPVVGDKFKFFNFNAAMMSEVAVPEAENRLLEAGKTYLAEAMKDPSNYDCVMMSDAMSGYDGEVIRPENALVLGLGRRVRLINLAYGSRNSRVIGYEMPLDFPWDSPKYTIGEKATYSRLGAIEDKLDAIEVSMGEKTYYSTSTGGDSVVNVGSSVYLIKAQDGTPPSESNAYSAIRARREFTLRNFAETIPYQWAFSKGLTIGNFVSTSSGAIIDYAGNAEVKSLISRGEIETKDKVTAPLVIADKENDGAVLSSSNFDGSSALAGTGYGILKEGNSYKMAIDYLTVRKGMTVAELVIQEYKSVGGVLVVSACNGEVEKVHKWSNGVGYDVYIKDFEDNPQFVAEDLVRCAQWDSETNSYVGYWVKVVAVPTDADGYKCLNLMASQFPEGVEPQVGDQLVQFGNTNDTSRQGLILISVENGQPNVTAYDGIDSADVNLLEKMCARLGDLNGIVIDKEKLQGYGLWTNNLYLSSKKVSDTFTEITNSITQAQQDASQALAGVATANQNIVDINKRLDGVVENWFEEGAPIPDKYPSSEWVTANDNLNHVGDTYTDILEYVDNDTTPTAGQSWRWVVAETEPTIGIDYRIIDLPTGETKYAYWTPIADSDAVKALLEASKAQYTADGKSRTFVSQPVPPYDEGDLWVQGTNGDILKCITARQEGESFSQSDWAKASKYTDDTETNALRTEVYSEFENVAGQFTSIQGEITTIKDKQSGMATQISEAETAITQNANQINLRATKTELAETETKLQASIDVNANAITSTVESLQSGGRNMLVGTNQGKNGWSIYPSSTSGAGYSVHLDEFVIGEQGDTTDVNKGVYKGVIIVRDDTSTNTGFFRFQLRPELFVAGKEYTLSFDAKSVGGTEFKPLFNIMKGNGTDALLSGYLSSEFNDTIKPNEWSRLYLTFTPLASGTADGGQVVFLATGNGIAWSSIYVKNLQIEEGTIASPWSETLADTEEKFSEIRQTADNISLKVVEKGVANINHAIGTEVPYVRNSNFDSTNTNLTQMMYKVTGFKTGDMITASFDWEWEGLSWANASTSEVSVQFTDVYGYLGLGFRLKSGGANSGHHTATVTLGQKYNTSTDITTSDVAYVYIRLSKIAQSATDGYFRISNLKVELGDEETAWTSRTDDLETAMVETGIDISHRKIVAKADNFEIRNNNGQVTASVNEKGELASNSVFCRNTDETTMATTPYLTTLNRNGNGFLEFFYPLTRDNGNDNLAFQIGWDESTESIFRFFNKSGVMTWKAGSEANLIDVTTLGGVVSTTEVALYKCVGTDRISALAEIMTTKSLATTKLYKKTSQTNDLVTTYYYTDSACTIFATGYYADGGVPRYAISTDGSSTKKYSRRVYTMTNGVASVSTYTWTED